MRKIREKVQRVFMNIMKNSLEAMEKGGTFKIQADEQNGEVVFSLADTGKGIPEEQIEDLFQPFTQADEARGSMGSGLGLAIVKRIVDLHKGRIALSNHPDGGLIATVTIPVKYSYIS